MSQPHRATGTKKSSTTEEELSECDRYLERVIQLGMVKNGIDEGGSQTM